MRAQAGQHSVRQAGGIVLTHGARGARVLVVQSSDGVHWLFPKGSVEPGETGEQAATREVREEAGIVAVARGLVGREQYSQGRRRVEVSYYVMDRVGEAAADEERETRWCTPAQARRLLSFEELKVLLDRALAM